MGSLAALNPKILEDPSFDPHEYQLRTDPEYRRRFNEALTARMFALIEAIAIKAGLSYDLATGEIGGLTKAEKEKLGNPGSLLGIERGDVKEFRPKHSSVRQAAGHDTATWRDQVYVGPNDDERYERVGEDGSLKLAAVAPVDTEAEDEKKAAEAKAEAEREQKAAEDKAKADADAAEKAKAESEKKDS